MYASNLETAYIHWNQALLSLTAENNGIDHLIE